MRFKLFEVIRLSLAGLRDELAAEVLDAVLPGGDRVQPHAAAVGAPRRVAAAPHAGQGGAHRPGDERRPQGAAHPHAGALSMKL